MPKPKGDVWNYVSEVTIKDKNGNQTVQCLLCDKKFQGSASRIVHHFIGGIGVQKCEKITPENEIYKKLRAEEDKKENEKGKKRKLEQLHRSTSGATTSYTQVSLKQMNQKASKEEVDQKIARAFFACGIPFSVVENPLFKEAVSAVASYGPGYKLPSDTTMRTTLLNKEYETVKQSVNESVLENVNLTGGTLVSDGWSNVQNRSLINYLFVTGKGASFVKCTDTSGEEKSANFIASEICKVSHTDE